MQGNDAIGGRGMSWYVVDVSGVGGDWMDVEKSKAQEREHALRSTRQCGDSVQYRVCRLGKNNREQGVGRVGEWWPGCALPRPLVAGEQSLGQVGPTSIHVGSQRPRALAGLGMGRPLVEECDAECHDQTIWLGQASSVASSDATSITYCHRR